MHNAYSLPVFRVDLNFWKCLIKKDIHTRYHLSNFPLNPNLILLLTYSTTCYFIFRHTFRMGFASPGLLDFLSGILSEVIQWLELVHWVILLKYVSSKCVDLIVFPRQSGVTPKKKGVFNGSFRNRSLVNVQYLYRLICSSVRHSVRQF